MKRKSSMYRAVTAAVLSVVMLLYTVPVSAAEGLTLFTPYTNLSAPPGEKLNYSIELINNTNSIQTANISFDAGSTGWEYELTAGGRNIRQIAVKPNDSSTMNLSLTVPLEVDKGDYHFRVNAGAFGSLPLVVNVSEKGSYKSELTVDRSNMVGHSDSTFTYSLTLNNRTASEQTYALSASAPTGWDAKFQVDGSSVSSVEVDANASKTISFSLTPPDRATADTYTIPIQAASGSSSAEVQVEAVITGTYGIELTTVNERLSANITAGQERKLELVVRNTGSADLSDINLTGTTPADWEVSFDPKTIPSIKAGESTNVTATIKASSKALAGDYVVGLTANAAEKSANATIRMTVKTSVLWGWIGVLIIIAVVAGVYGLFRKYGRR